MPIGSVWLPGDTRVDIVQEVCHTAENRPQTLQHIHHKTRVKPLVETL